MVRTREALLGCAVGGGLWAAEGQGQGSLLREVQALGAGEGFQRVGQWGGGWGSWSGRGSGGFTVGGEADGCLGVW